MHQRTQPPEPESLLIHCPGQDVYARLFGNLAINSEGKQYFRTGMISAQSEPSTTICLVDPPNARDRFWQSLSDILEQGYFIANGERVELPPSLRLELYHTPAADIDAFRQTVTNTPVNPDKTCGVINTFNFAEIFKDLSAQGNTLQQTDTFEKMASQFDQLAVTGELTDRQWRILKQRTELLPTVPGLVTGPLPEPSGASVVSLHTSTVANVAANHCYHLATEQHWEALWFSEQLKLSGTLSFRLKQSPLLKKLLAGEAVVLTGLEQAPVLAGHLQSLLAPEPYLWIYGQKINLPNCRVHIVWPSDRLPSPWLQRWQQQQDTGSSESTSIVESVMAHYPDAVGPITRLLESVRTLPISPDKSYPLLPVQAPSEFLTLLESQLHIEQSLDQSRVLESFHWRKALNKLLAHPVRADDAVYSFVKAQISARFPDQGVDVDGIVDILNALPALKQPMDLADNFWPLARYMAPALADSLPATFTEITPCAVDKMAAIIQSLIPQESINAEQWPVLEDTDNIHLVHGHRLRLLYDALLVLASDGQYRGIAVHQYARILDDQLSAITQSHPSDPVPQLQQHLQEQFRHCFSRSTTPLQSLATEWLKARRSHDQQQAKRLEQLTAMLKQHKIIELNGPSGTGKSCLAVATGQALQEQHRSSMHWLVAAIDAKLGQRTVKNLTLGPNTTWEDLYGSIILKKDRHGNLVSQTKPGQLSDWARSARPGLLVINEANLVHRGILSPLIGLRQTPPRLCVNGQTIWLTDNHRVLLTGNPENYQGRNLEPELKSRVLRLYYRPLPQSILQQAIIEPLLPDAWPGELKSTASANILSVLAQYHKLVAKDYQLTPRDLKDILARFRLIAADAPCPTSNEQLFALADEACQQSLGGRIDREKRSEWQALRAYWNSSGKVDSQVLEQHQRAFNEFFRQLVQVNNKRPKPLVVDTPGTREYIRTCWQFLQLRKPGRVAMVVEGSAGWGKDVLLLLTLATWQQLTGKGYQHLNGAPDRFTEFVQAFNRAWRLGEVLVVSELNIIPSGLLEEFLNDRLPLPHKAGFKLIGTVNPPTYPGRSAFPPSLASRFTGVHIHSDVLADYRLRLQALGASDALSQWLTNCVSDINHYFRQQHCPLELTLPQVLQAADQLTRTPIGQWRDCLAREWDAYLQHCPYSFKLPGIPGRSAKKPSPKAAATGWPKIFNLGLPSDVHIEFNVTVHFPSGWSTSHYRLELLTVWVTDDQHLATNPLPTQPINHSYLLPVLPWRGSLQAGETPGHMTLRPGSKWQPLPSLTPDDRLTGIRTIPAQVQLELAHDKHNGQYFLRSQHKEPVAVDFIIKPDEDYFAPITYGDFIDSQPQRCPALIKVHLDQEIFTRQPTQCPAYQRLREIAEIKDLSERLMVLADWFRGFSADRHCTETGMDLVKRLLREKRGTCRHRAFLFQLLCCYWGIEARMVGSANHRFVEVRCRSGWRRCDLSGTAKATVTYSSAPEWDSLYQPAPVQPVDSPGEPNSGVNDSGWNRVLSRAISVCQQWQRPVSLLPEEALNLIRDTVLDEFQKNFRPIPLDKSFSRCFFYSSLEVEVRIDAFGIVYHYTPKQYLLAARQTIDHFSTLALPEKKAIIDWSYCMLNWAFGYQSPKEHLFCQWAEFAWQLYQRSPGDFPVLPVQSLQAMIRFNFDHDGMAQRMVQRLFRIDSIDRTYLEKVSDSSGAGNFSLLYPWETLPQVPVAEVCWSHSAQGRPDITRLIRGEPCFPMKSNFYQETNTLIFSAQFLIDRALDALKQSINKLTGAPFIDELPGRSTARPTNEDFINHAENNWQLIRLISDKCSAEIYSPVICQELERFRVLIVGNFSNQLTIFESPAGQNFNLIGSGLLSAGITLDCRESLEKIKRLINEHDASIVSS